MPTVDGGHIFLTLLAPVKLGEIQWEGRVTSHSHALREELGNLPTAAQSPISLATGLDSPFACCTRTHFLRLFVIDQPMFNGRNPMNPLAAAFTALNPLAGKAAKARANPLIHQQFDVLSRPWLVLSADLDRRADLPDDGLAAWAAHLWEKSGEAMRAVFSHCHGFDDVKTGEQFAAYLKRCQVETTMSFNDYWPGRPPLKGTSLGRLALELLGVALGLYGLACLLIADWNPAGSFPLWPVIPALLAGLLFALWRLWSIGRKPFPAAPDSDLPSVLKALHCQQRFAKFAETVQGSDRAALYSAFGQFLADVRPADVVSPTQKPGVIRSDGVDLVLHEAVQPKRVVQ